jgi:hypothetical protein
MISLKINIKNQISKDLASKIKKLDQVPKDAYTFFVAHTPIRSGNARRHTYLKKDIIHAAYPYAKRLNDGYSRQAPDGMTKPTEAFVKQTVDKIIKGK